MPTVLRCHRAWRPVVCAQVKADRARVHCLSKFTVSGSCSRIRFIASKRAVSNTNKGGCTRAHTHKGDSYSSLLLSLKPKVLTYGQTPGPERWRQTAGWECWPCSNTLAWYEDAKQRRAGCKRIEIEGKRSRATAEQKEGKVELWPIA